MTMAVVYFFSVCHVGTKLLPWNSYGIGLEKCSSNYAGLEPACPPV